MTYVVLDNCIKCKYTDCVEVCPVDCFYEGENFLVINPDECIDCGVCEPECPAEAIKPDTEPGLIYSPQTFPQLCFAVYMPSIVFCGIAFFISVNLSAILFYGIAFSTYISNSE